LHINTRIIYKFDSRTRSREELSVCRQKVDVSAETCPDIGIQFAKWKNCFIEDNISRYIDLTFSNIKAFKPLVHVTIAEKHILFRPKL
jgi:hypothetical protein